MCSRRALAVGIALTAVLCRSSRAVLLAEASGQR
jgi:hypothetical protein